MLFTCVLLQECVRKSSLHLKTTGNPRNSANFTGKDWNKLPKSNSSYSINTRSTLRSEIVISCAKSVTSYYNQLLNEDLVVPNEPTKKKIEENPSKNRNTKQLRYKNSTRVTKTNLRTGRLKKVARHQRRNESVLFENVVACTNNSFEDNSTTSENIGEDSDEVEEAEQEVALAPRKSFFERSVEGFCQIHPAFNKATYRCLHRLSLVQSAISMNSPASPQTPALPTMLATSSTAHTHAFQPHVSPTTAVLLAQTANQPHSGKRKHSDDSAINDHNYPINNANTTPPGHHSAKHQHLQISNNSTSTTNQFRLSPRSWIFQTPDKQKLGKLPPPSTVRDDEDDGHGQPLIVPVMLHHSKRLKTVYSFDESTVVDFVQGVNGSGGSMEVQIDSDRLAPICQISTTDDGGDCEFESSNITDVSPNVSSTNVSITTTCTSSGMSVSEELNQFQLQAHELTLDLNTVVSPGAGKPQHTSRLGGGDGDTGEGAFLDQWVQMNAGGSGDHSPLRLLQTNLPSTSRYFPTNKAQTSINQHLRTIHNVATQRPTKTLPRFDRRQYLERKSLTFEETNCSPGTSETPKVGDCASTLGGRLRALKQKAASADSISGSSPEGIGGRKRSMDLFNVGRGETIRDLSEISETITSGAYEREMTEPSHNQENILPPSHMQLLLGNLQMNDSVEINYEHQLFPRRHY